MPKSQPLKKLQNKIFGYLADKTTPELEKLTKVPTQDFFAKHLLSDQVAENLGINDEPKKLILNFAYFNSSVCIFNTADSSKMKSLLEKLARICHFESNQFSTCDLKPRLVYNTGEYGKLFKHLDEDVENLYEIDIAGSGRFYGFIVENFYFVAVDTDHRNTH